MNWDQSDIPHISDISSLQQQLAETATSAAGSENALKDLCFVVADGMCWRALDEALQQLEQPGKKAFDVYFSLLRRCGNARSLSHGKRVHQHLISSGHGENPVLGDLLVQMYGKCGSVEDARAVFDRLPRRNVFSWNFMIRAYARQGHSQQALDMYHRMASQGLRTDGYGFASVLGTCSALGALDEGKAIHARAIESGMASESLVQAALLNMYAKCKDLERAREIFDGIEKRDVVSWNDMIVAYAQNGHYKEALELYREMDVQPDRVTFSCLLAACSNLGALEEGKAIHARADSTGFKADVVVQTAALNMYGKCGELDSARRVFDGTQGKNVVSWNSMIAAYVLHGHHADALEVYDKMGSEGLQPSNSTFASALHACASLQDLDRGKAIQARMIENGTQPSVILETALVTMYGKCGKLDAARGLFDRMQGGNAISYNAMIAAYAQHGHFREALELYKAMVTRGVVPDAATFATVLSTCSSVEDLEDGRAIHERVNASEVRSVVKVQNALMSMYARCGSLDSAKMIFDRMQHRDSVSWNAMIGAYVQHGHSREAIDLFDSMEREGMQRDVVAVVSALFACSLLGDEHEGKRIHAQIMRSDLHEDMDVNIATLNMYSDCGRLDLARQAFDRMPSRCVKSWNAIIAAYSKHDRGRDVLHVYKRMQLDGLQPDAVTFATALGVCFSLREGQAIHAQIVESGFERVMVVETALVSMFAKCHRLEAARAVFDAMQEKNAVSWTTMIAAYAQDGLPREAVNLFYKMDVQPDDITYAIVFGACASAGALNEGRAIHEQLVANRCPLGVVGATGLVNMYAKCGKLDVARQLFEKMESKTLISWTTMIAAYAQHSRGREALDLYTEMVLEGVVPDSIAFISILIACSHEGMLALCRTHFTSMIGDYGIVPILDHYNCVIDLLGRAGWTREAEELINTMPFEPHSVAWTTLLGACTTHGDIERGGRVAECAYELEPENTSSYVLLSNMYVAAGLKDETVETIKKRLANKEFRRMPASSIANTAEVEELALS